MSYIPIPNPNNITLTKEEVDQIFKKLNSIDALTNNDYIHAATDNIRKILNN